MRERMHTIPMADGWEQDCMTGWRRVLTWKSGERSRIKRRYRRRLRRHHARECEHHARECEVWA